MKNGFSEKEIKLLFSTIEQNSQKNISNMKSFEQVSAKIGKNMLTIRNFYYNFVKILQKNHVLQKKLNIDLSKHVVQKYEHFEKDEEKKLVSQIEEFVKKGHSVREACQILSNGDIKQMIRLQNKYQNTKNECKVLQFPKQEQKGKTQKLSNQDINSLFLGLVKLVREQAFGESQEKVKEYLEFSSQEKRKSIIDAVEKQKQIDLLTSQIKELEQKNKALNDQLCSYRVEYVKTLNKDQNNLVFND